MFYSVGHKKQKKMQFENAIVSQQRVSLFKFSFSRVIVPARSNRLSYIYWNAKNII